MIRKKLTKNPENKVTNNRNKGIMKDKCEKWIVLEAKMARKKSSEDREEELLGRITMKMIK
jgi:hypothetical protein